jgi:hypothetical protein
MPDIGLDTGYRADDWDERDEDWKRLDYHHLAIDLAAGEMRDILWRTAKNMRDGERHIPDHLRNTLALLLRYVCSFDCRMTSDQMKVFICGLADQAYREDRIRIFHAGLPHSSRL